MLSETNVRKIMDKHITMLNRTDKDDLVERAYHETIIATLRRVLEIDHFKV